MADNFVTRILITAKDEASSVFGSLQAKAAGVATAIAGYFAANFLGGAISSAADFEQAMSRVAAATGATGAELQQLKRAAEEAAAGSAFSQVQTAQALENLAKAGLNAKDSIAALPGVMALAAAGDIDLAQSAEIVTRTVAGMGIAVEETGRIADVLAKGANASNTSVKGLAEALSYTAPTARSVGLTLEQTVAILGKFADGGIDASRAGTALNSVLSQFLDPASKFRGELTAIGITTGDFDKALRQLAASGETGSKAIRAVGTEAGPALRSLLNQGVPALDNLTNQLKGAAGSAAETAAVIQGNLNGALNSLSGAWTSLKTALGEPVLPVLTQGVKDLAASLRAAVADGTATRFGEAIKAAFSGAIEWVKKFAAEVDPAALSAKLQETAAKVGAWFDGMAEKARNAGDIVRTAYGVMSAGVNTIMAGLYKLAEVQSAVWSAMLGGIASVADGLAKISPGAIGDKFREAAAEVRIHAGAMGAVSDEFGRKASQAFADVVEGADLAGKGWAGLTKPAEDAKAAVEAVAKAAAVTADQLDAAGEGATVAGGKIQALGTQAKQAGADQKAAAAETMKAVGELRAEYDKLLAGGDVNGAVLKLEEIRKALAGLKGDAKATAEDIKAAYGAMGIASAADLKAKEAEFKRHYDAIKSDGTATADILAQAFKAYAEKAIAANGGIASEALKSEASLRGVRIEADETGKAIVKIGSAAGQASAQVGSAMDGASGSIRRARTEADALQDALTRIKTQRLGDGNSVGSMDNPGTFEDMRRAGVTPEQMRTAGYSSRQIEDYVTQNDKAAPGTVNRQVSSNGVNLMQMGVEAGLNMEEIRKLQEIAPYYVAKTNAEAKGMRSLGSAESLRAEYTGIVNNNWKLAIDEARRLVSEEGQKKGGSAGNSAGFQGGPGRTVTLNLNINGRSNQLHMADQQSADDLVRILQTQLGAQP